MSSITNSEILFKLKAQGLDEAFLDLVNEIKILKESLLPEVNTLIDSKIVNFLSKINLSHGSCRAPMSLKDTFSFPDLFIKLNKYIVKGGGHALAAGFAIKSHDLENFSDEANKQLQDFDFETKADNENIINLKFADLNEGLLSKIISLDPFGIDFPFPKISVVLPPGLNVKIMDSKKNETQCHIRFLGLIPIVLFNIDRLVIEDFIENEKTMNEFEVLMNIDQNTFNGKTNFQLIINEFRIVE
jgi:hypothetical protein